MGEEQGQGRRADNNKEQERHGGPGGRNRGRGGERTTTRSRRGMVAQGEESIKTNEEKNTGYIQ